mgnify:FL=1|jgi:mannose-6-phosphate isomerase-like protein (cupin superfamily)|tara:strand:+ start:33 stop:785 length:753 start_codon:yes stop_codon:yes gene_type:complete
MSTNLRIVEKLIYSLDDEIEFKRIQFDVQKIKNQNYNFENTVVNKPWGHEYLFYSSKEVSIWVLKILKNQKTSMHCHPNKKTSLILLEGEANLYTLNKKINLKCGNAVTIDKGVFHRTSSEYDKDILVMEIETPTNKNDIVRYKDQYNRSNSGYETKDSFSEAKNLEVFLDYKSIKDNNRVLGNCEINIIDNTYQKIKILDEKTLISPIKIKNKKYRSEIKLGEIYEKNFFIKNEELLLNIEELLVIRKK